MQKEILYNLNKNIMDIEKNPWQQAEVEQTNTKIILPRHSISIKEGKEMKCLCVWKQDISMYTRIYSTLASCTLLLQKLLWFWSMDIYLCCVLEKKPFLLKPAAKVWRRNGVNQTGTWGFCWPTWSLKHELARSILIFFRLMVQVTQGN